MEDVLGLVGTTIAEKYAVEAVVGEGGFAMVYRATHLLWRRPVAVKVFKALADVAPSDRERMLEEFIQEGRLLAELSERSTAIVQARDVGMLQTATGMSVPYMVLEWLEGRSLEAILSAERAARLPLRSLGEAVALLEPAAEALAIAHRRGIAHRDVKPANVFVIGDSRRDCTVKLLDFGIAKVVSDVQKFGFGKTAGVLTSFTPAYGAPEQFNRAYGATGPWTDVFALALVLVEILVGHEVLTGESLVQLAYASADPAVRPTPRRFGLPCSDEVEAVFRKAGAVNPAERYPSVGDFWAALRSLTGGVVGAPVTSSRGSASFATSATQALPSSGTARIASGSAARLSGSGQAAGAVNFPPGTGVEASGAPAGAGVGAAAISDGGGGTAAPGPPGADVTVAAPASTRSAFSGGADVTVAAPASTSRAFSAGAEVSAAARAVSPEARAVSPEAQVVEGGAGPGNAGGAPAAGRRPSSTVVALGALVVVLAGLGVGGAVFAQRLRRDSILASSATVAAAPGSGAGPSSTVAAPSASTSSSGAACPAGMRRIPGGAFFMGADELDAEPDEKPPHRVVLAPYCLDEREVTVARYKACSDRGACLRAGKENLWPGITREQQRIYDPLCNANDSAMRLEHPVNCVGWEQARQFCEATGDRLPTEAEWEFAARGSDGRTYPWGDEPPGAKLLNACGPECVAWMTAHPDPDQPVPAPMFAESDGFPNTAPVGSFPAGASQYGILDIAGNVWEWVADWYAPYEPGSASTTSTAPTGPVRGDKRVIRGGAWNGARAPWVRPSWRFSAPPAYRTHGIGFRCARSL